MRNDISEATCRRFVISRKSKHYPGILKSRDRAPKHLRMSSQHHHQQMMKMAAEVMMLIDGAGIKVCYLSQTPLIFMMAKRCLSLG